MVSPPRLSLLLLLAASNAHAWQVFFQVTSETTLRGSSETSTAASRADANQERTASTGAAGSPCRGDVDCHGQCEAGVCVDPVAPVSQPVPGTSPIPGCVDDQSCAIGYGCVDQRCVQRTEPQLPQPPVVQPCASDVQCAPGQSCVNGQCLSPPPILPLPGPGEGRGEGKTSSPSLQRLATEVYLRERAVQLRQDLALGEGPVISMLALEHRIPAPQLGRTLRAHRAELAALLQDDADLTWPARFLERLDTLCAQQVRVTRR